MKSSILVISLYMLCTFSFVVSIKGQDHTQQAKKSSWTGLNQELVFVARTWSVNGIEDYVIAEKVRQLIYRGANPNTRYDLNYERLQGLGSVIGIFARNNNVLALSILLEADVDPNLESHVICQVFYPFEKKSIAITPLWEAILSDSYEAAEVLLKAGADTEFELFRRTPIQGNRNDKPLSDRMVNLLLSHDANDVGENIYEEEKWSIWSVLKSIKSALLQPEEREMEEERNADFYLEGKGYYCNVEDID